jgi:hypothetical protein
MRNDRHPMFRPMHKFVVRAAYRNLFEPILQQTANNITAIPKHVRIPLCSENTPGALALSAGPNFTQDMRFLAAF